MSRPWSDAEDAALRAMYRSRPIPAALRAALPGRTDPGIIQRAAKLGVAARRAPAWTAQEDRTVAALYPDLARHAALRASLPGRTWTAVKIRADRLGVTCLPPRWSAAEDKILADGWRDRSIRTLMHALPGRSRLAIHRRADELGLGHGVPQGYESFAAACRRVGFDRELLAPILAAAGVRRHRVNSQCEAAEYHTYVEPDEVDAAVAAHLQTETVRAAAVARGLCDKTLRDWLKRAGAIVGRGHARTVRVRSDVVDRVVEQHRATYRPQRRVA